MKPPSLDSSSVLTLKVFVMVADVRNFSIAARKLNLSASTITSHISNLEKNIGTALFNRTTRQVSITEAGAYFYDRCKSILSEIDQAVSDLMPKDFFSGRLRISATPSFSSSILANVITSFSAENPDVSIEVLASSTLPNLVNERIDIAFMVNEKHNTSYANINIGRVSRVFCASRAYLLKYGLPNTIEELFSRRCLLNVVAGVSEPWIINENGERKEIHVSGPLSSDNGDVLKASCLGGLGIGNFYRFHVSNELSHNYLIEILSEYHPEKNNVYALTPHREIMSPLALHFIEKMRDFLYKC